jgi:anti-repressor protein
MNELKIFEKEEFGKVRVVGHDGDPWFVAKDVCECLELGNPRSSLALLDEDEKGVHSVDTPGGKQEMTIVSEPGLYSLILRSRKPEAKAFKRWVTHDILPSIRKTGGYGVAALPQTYIEALEALVESEKAKQKALETVEYQKPLVQIAETRIDKKGCFSLTDINKSLGLKRGLITNWAKSKGYIHQRLCEVNKAGEKYFKIYSTDGVHNQIGVTEDGVQLIKSVFA